VNGKRSLIVLTGGEPYLQSQHEMYNLCRLLSLRGHRIQIETNGTVANSDISLSAHYVVCSPKQEFKDIDISLDEVTCWKLLYPYQFDPEPYFEYASKFLAKQTRVSFYIQPIAGMEGSVEGAIEEVKKRAFPWRLSLQIHKIIGVQ
jgi:organic radical activating enzyme